MIKKITVNCYDLEELPTKVEEAENSVKWLGYKILNHRLCQKKWWEVWKDKDYYADIFYE